MERPLEPDLQPDLRDVARRMPPRALVVDDPRFGRHVAVGHHPERPERLLAAREALARRAADGAQFDIVTPRTATDDELVRVHDPRFVEALNAIRGETGYVDPDTFVSPESVDVARLAAGSLVSMVDALIDGPVPKGVALLRPPGHHARPSRAMGFCLINNVAVAAAHARARGLGRVAIVDWDVHHGNGTQEIFWTDPHVLYISTHQWPFYPGTGGVDEAGEREGEGYTVNVPLAAGAGDAVFASAFQRVILPVLEEFGPDLLLVSAGFDAAARDPLAQMELSANAFGWMARELARAADPSAGGKMALVLEGGYDLVALEEGIGAAVDGMLWKRAGDIGGAPDDEGVRRAAECAGRVWKGVD